MISAILFPVKARVSNWIKRYLPAEIVGSITLFVVGLGIDALFHNPVFTAFGGAYGEFIGYYGTILFNDLRKQKVKHTKITARIFIKTIKHLFFEFGVAEFLDSFLVRPFALYIFPLLLHNVGLGLIVGKIAADIIFYIPTIIAYELRMKFGKE